MPGNIVRRLKPHFLVNRAFCDTSTKFGTELEYYIVVYFREGPQPNFTCVVRDSHFSKWPPYNIKSIIYWLIIGIGTYFWCLTLCFKVQGLQILHCFQPILMQTSCFTVWLPFYVEIHSHLSVAVQFHYL